MHGRSLKAIKTSRPYCASENRARRVFLDQTDIACTQGEALWGVQRVERRVGCILLRARSAVNPEGGGLAIAPISNEDQGTRDTQADPCRCSSKQHLTAAGYFGWYNLPGDEGGGGVRR